MKYLALSLVLCALLPMANGHCYRKPVTSMGTFCQDDVDNTWHPVGSTWRNSQCMDCDCGECCSAYSTPRSFPEDCVAEFDAKACKYNVHKKGDPSVSCPIYSAVGK